MTRWQLRRAWLTGGYGFGVVVMDSFLVPLRARELGASLFWIGIILGLPVVGSYVFGSAIGDLTNRLGVRRTFQLAAAGTVVTSAAMALAGHWWVLLMVQVMHRWLWFAGWISSQAYIATLQDDPDLRVRNAGRFTSVGAVCRAAAPLLAAVVADWHGLRFGFLVVAAYSALCCALGLSLASHRASRPTADAEALESAAETLSEGAPSEAEGAREEREEHALGGRNTFALTRKAGTVVPFFLAFCWIWVMVICTSFYGLLLVERGFSKIMASVVIGCIGVSAILTSLLVTKVARSMSNQILAGLVLASCGAGFMLVPIVVNAVLVLLVFLPAILAGVAEGITSPLVIAIVGEDAEARPEGVTAARRFSAVGNAQLASWAAPTFMGLVSGLVGLTAAFPFAGAVVLGLVGTAMAHHGIGRLLGDGPASLFALLLAMLRNSLRRRR